MPIIGPPTTGYVTLAQIREYGPDLSSVADATLDAARQWFEAKLEAYVGIAFVPRVTTSVLDGSGCDSLRFRQWPVRAVISVEEWSGSAWVPWSADALADLDPDDIGLVWMRSGTWPRGRRNLRIEYEHGLGDDVPLDIVDAALVAIHDKARRDVTPASRAGRVYALQTEVGVERRTRAGDNHPFGIDEVDEVAVRYRGRYWVPALG